MDTCKDEKLMVKKPPARLYYDTGVYLDAADMKAEQLYHRAQLSRALAFLHGYGTVAGLRVKVAEEDDPEWLGDQERHLVVQPGIAVDRLGRLIEVPRKSCIRLGRWWKDQKQNDLRKGELDGADNGVVVDVFITFHECGAGKTPAMATGPFDALDAVAPSRIHDHYKLDLIIRENATLPPQPWLAQAPTPGPADPMDVDKLHEAVFDAWPGIRDMWDPKKKLPAALSGHPHGVDPAALFLARLNINVKIDPADDKPPKWPADAEIKVDNNLRQFLYATTVLAKRLGMHEK